MRLSNLYTICADAFRHLHPLKLATAVTSASTVRVVAASIVIAASIVEKKNYKDNPDDPFATATATIITEKHNSFSFQILILIYIK